MFPLSYTVGVAAQAGAKAAALAKKKQRVQRAVSGLTNLGDQLSSGALDRAAALNAQAEAARAQLAGPDSGTATVDEASGGSRPGFFSGKGLLIVGAAVAVLLLFRRRG